MIKFFLTLLCIFACCNLTAVEFDPEVTYMDKLALETDPNRSSGKSSNWHFYTEIYPKYFATIKDKPLKFLEIGIYKGNGVKLWEAYFPNADLHFVDITFGFCEYFSERSHYHLADQEDPDDLLRVVEAAGGNVDIIIDDGGHTMNQQLVSFQTLFPYLNRKGIYIIEDLHTSYWEKPYHGGGTIEEPKSGPGTFVNFLKDLIDEVNYVGARTQSANHYNIPPEIEEQLSEYSKNIFSMHFYDSLCIIIKR